LRHPQTGDVTNSVYNDLLVKTNKAPRTFYYLGKIPTNGSLDVYSMKDFETLTPLAAKDVQFKTSNFEPANKNNDLSNILN
jgi:hypothetical protein